jgi:hypothetical protein
MTASCLSDAHDPRPCAIDESGMAKKWFVDAPPQMANTEPLPMETCIEAFLRLLAAQFFWSAGSPRFADASSTSRPKCPHSYAVHGKTDLLSLAAVVTADTPPKENSAASFF